MPEGSNSPASTAASDADAEEGRLHDVFISYASADGGLANALVASLEHHGLRCWIAPRDVTPGALYADVIIRAINGAKALVLVLSRNSMSSSHVGKEVERASAKHRPIIAVRTDATPLTPALEYFLSESQWIDVADEEIDSVAARVLAAVHRLGAVRTEPTLARAAPARPTKASSGSVHSKPRLNGAVWTIAVVLLAGLIYLLADKFWFSKHHEQPVASSPVAEPPAASSPSRVEAAAPPHSIAVLPFVNMSGDPKEDYFSDGLSEELLNSLAAIPELKVAARTSSFSFKGKNADVADIARKLNVGAVLEGSVRKDGNEVRITAQLINASTGFHLWSHIYDRNLKNILALQTEIATAVTQALQATLMANAAASIELGGTHNPLAFDAYLRGENLRLTTSDKEHEQQAITDFEEAVRLDPDFAKGYAGLARAQAALASEYLTADEARLLHSRARTNAERAIALAPELGIAHAALGGVLEDSLDFAGAQHAYEQALALSPNDAGVLLRAGVFWVRMGRTEAGLADAQKAVTLDPLSAHAYSRSAIALQDARRYRESIEAGKRALEINPTDMDTKHALGLSQLLVGDPAAARTTCEVTPRTWLAYVCLAILYHRIQRQHEAEGELAALRAQFQATASYQYAEIYAQWGDVLRALDALDSAYHVRDPGVADLKVDEFLDPLRHEPRFQAIEQKLNFPK